MGITGYDNDGLLERLIRWLSPAWAYRRAQFREALRLCEEAEQPRRRSDDGGWLRLDDPNNPLNPDRITPPRQAEPERRRWTW